MHRRVPVKWRIVRELRAHQRRHTQVEAHEAARENGRCTTRQYAVEELAEKEQLNLYDKYWRNQSSVLLQANVAAASS